MKKRVFINILVALLLLSSILVSLLLGVTKAEYFKKISKKVDFEVNPDLKFEYLVYDAQATKDDSKTTKVDEAEYTLETGVYENATSFVQPILTTCWSSVKHQLDSIIEIAKNKSCHLITWSSVTVLNQNIQIVRKTFSNNREVSQTLEFLKICICTEEMHLTDIMINICCRARHLTFLNHLTYNLKEVVA